MLFQKRIKILLVADPDPDHTLLISQMVEQADVVRQLVCMDNGALVLDYLLQRRGFADRNLPLPSLIILENNLPEVSGLEILRLIKADPNLLTIPVIMLCEAEPPQLIHDCYAARANGFISKPIDPEKFSAAIRSLVEFWGQVNEYAPNPIP